MKRKPVLLLVILAGILMVQPQKSHSQNVVVQAPLHFDVSIPLRDMKPAKKHFWDRFRRENEEKEVPNRFKHIPPTTERINDPAWQANYISSGGSKSPAITNPIVNFNGTGNNANSGRVTPPDPNGDVGPNHYVQIVNCELQVFSKTGTSLYGPVATSTLWSGFSGAWTGHNDGDAVVLYDEQADRWLIAQFAIDCGTYPSYTEYELVAISVSGDPTGSYNRYAFQFDYMPDYPKFGIWQDGYYMAVNRFNTNTGSSPFIGAAACVLNRTKMLAGDGSATMQYFKTETLGGSGSATGSYCYSMLPSDCDGTWASSGTPNYFTYLSDNTEGPANELRVWSLHADWTTPANSSFTYVTNLPVSAYTMLGTGTGVVPQQGTTNKVDGLGDRLMYRNQYRNFSSYESFLTCHSVSVNSVSGVRWYEYRRTGGTWSVYQQSTYAPSDGKWRWLGSVAMNSSGDIGMAYTVSGSSTYPSIYFTGRRAADPLNTMSQPEGIIQTGTASITGATRWGDYAEMSVDPSDNTTFWTTNEYIGTFGGTWPWATKIASFKWSNQPAVTTTDATAVTPTSATLNGIINSNGLASTYYFEWGTTASYGTNTTTTSAGSGSSAIPVNTSITGLTGGITYHFRLDGVNSDGTTNGNDMTFTPGVAVVTTTAATAITITTATCGGNVVSDGGATVTARGTCWSTSANPIITGSHTTDGSGTGSFTSSLTGLTANTLYHIRGYATNTYGTWYGSDLTFTTTCSISTLPFNESFTSTSIPSCWNQADHQGNGEIWQFGTIANSGAPNLTGNYAYLNSRNYGSGNTQNADLISPVLDCSAYNTVTLGFSHYFYQGGGASGILSYSSDGGTTWNTIQTWTTSTANPATFSQVIAGAAGSATVRFRWNYSGTYGYWWAIDNVSVTGTTTNTLSVTPTSQNVPASPAGSTTFSVTSNTSWTASSDKSWCTVTPSGTGNGTITANYSINTLVGSRVATITVTVTGVPLVTVTVVQAGVAPTLSVIPSNQNVPDSPAGTTSFTVNSNTDWAAVSDQTWCTVNSSGTGNGTITASYTGNISTSSRVANITVTVSGMTPVTVTVTQSGVSPTLSVTPSNQNIGYLAGNTTFTVLSNSSWTAASDSAWLSVTPTGTGNGTIDAAFLQNPYYKTRVATITVTVTGISPQMVTVTQAQSTVSVREHTADMIRIIPNPSRGTFRIDAGKMKFASLNVTIMDITGRTILQRECREKADMLFDLSASQEGSYFIKITADDQEVTQKLILTH